MSDAAMAMNTTASEKIIQGRSSLLLHQFEEVVFEGGADFDKKAWCCSCHSKLPYRHWGLLMFNEGYRCAVCKSGKRVLCKSCYDSATAPRGSVKPNEFIRVDPSFFLSGCRGAGGETSVEEQEEDDDEQALLKQSQLPEDNDLAVERLPKNFVPSDKGNLP